MRTQPASARHRPLDVAGWPYGQTHVTVQWGLLPVFAHEVCGERQSQHMSALTMGLVLPCAVHGTLLPACWVMHGTCPLGQTIS